MRFLLPILLSGLLVGCLRFEAKPLAPLEAMGRIESRSLADPGLAAFMEKYSTNPSQDWPRRSWDLPNLTLAAFYFHPGLDVARAQWQVTEAEVISAGARPNPTIGIAPEFSFDPDSGVSPWIAGFNFDIPIETAGKRGYRIDQAKHLSEAARLNIGRVAWDVFSNLRDNLLAFAMAGRRIELLKARQQVQDEIVKLFERRLEAGAIAPYDLTGARIELARTQLQSQEAQRQLIKGRTGVAEALGLPAEAVADVQLDYDLEQIPPAVDGVREARRQALHNRMDIAGALAEYAASQSALQLEIARQYPDIHIGSGYQYDQGQDKWALGIAVELPVFNQNQGGIAGAEARRAESAARFMALQAGIVSAIDWAVAQQRLALDQLRSAAVLLATQEQQFAATELQYQAGEIDLLDYLAAKLELANAGSVGLDALGQVHESEGALEDAIRRPLDTAAWEDIRQPDSTDRGSEDHETQQ
jgi:outer membrane protein TolC